MISFCFRLSGLCVCLYLVLVLLSLCNSQYTLFFMRLIRRENCTKLFLIHPFFKNPTKKYFVFAHCCSILYDTHTYMNLCMYLCMCVVKHFVSLTNRKKYSSFQQPIIIILIIFHKLIICPMQNLLNLALRYNFESVIQ